MQAASSVVRIATRRTPSVFLNGVQLHGYDDSGPPSGHGEGDLASLTVEQWVQQVLDPTPDGAARGTGH